MDIAKIALRLMEIWTEILDLDQEPDFIEDFFELGGDSFDATVLASELHKEFAVEIPMSKLFQNSTLQSLAQIIAQATVKQYEPVLPIPRQKYYPLSSAQKRMFALHQLEGEIPGYNVSRVKMIEGLIDQVRFIAAVQQLITRHESLRTSFHIVNFELVQQVHDQVECSVIFREVSESDVVKLAEETIRPFDLSTVPLFRVVLLQVTVDRHILILDLHHIISDKASIDLLIHDLIYLYEGRELPELSVQYKEFAVWQNQIFSSKSMETYEAFWLELLKGEIKPMNLPLDYPRPPVLQFAGDRVEFAIPADLTEQLRNLVKEQGMTLFMILLAAYHILWLKYTGVEDQIVGIPVSGRTHPDVQSIVGLFVNTVPIRNQVEERYTILQFLQKCKERCLQVFENQVYPLEKLVGKLSIQREQNRNPIFDVCFNMVTEESYVFPEVSRLKIWPYRYKVKRATFDLTLVGCEAADHVDLELEYRTALFARQTIQKIAKDYLEIVQQIALDPEIRLDEVRITEERLRAETPGFTEGDFDF